MTADLTRLIADAFLPDPPRRIGVAVSGGSDSLALLHLLHEFSAQRGIALFAATVDHGLRPEAQAEAGQVAALCKEMGVPHDTLRWTGWDHSGNLQNAARLARYRLLSDWGRARNVGVIALGHTLDDQAETFVMRLARRAGVDGLAAMEPLFNRNEMQWIRPLLGARRAQLRDYLADRNVQWADDPSNDDDRFDRIRARKALAVLGTLGIDPGALSDVAQNMAAAKQALTRHTLDIARDCVTLKLGAVGIAEDALRTQPPDLQRRLLLHALHWVNSAVYAPRATGLAHVTATLAQQTSATLQGCELRRKGQTLWIFRELQAVRNVETRVTDLWDNRWKITPPTKIIGPIDEYSVRALGPEGLRDWQDWRSLGVPRGALLSTPAVWQGAQLIAVPLAGGVENWQADLESGEGAFFAANMTH